MDSAAGHPAARDAATRLTPAVLCIAALGPAAAALLYVHAARSPGAFQVIYYTSKGLVFALPALFWIAVERRARIASPRCSRSRDLTLGLVTGVSIGAVLVAAYAFGFTHWIDHQTVRRVVADFGIGDHFLLFALFIAVVNSACEEYYWRWFVFGRMQRIMRVAPAIVLGSLAFGAHHFIVLQHALGSTGLAALFTAGVATGGVIWSIQFHRTGRLLGIWLSHFLIDVAAMVAIHDMIS